MPFRHANAYGGYDYPAFPSPGGFDFINYDAVSDPMMSPYDSFSLPTPPEVSSWTPTSQNTDSQHSDSLSPLDSTFASSTSASPGDGVVHNVSAAQLQAMGAAASAVTSMRNGDLPDQQQIFQDFKTIPIAHASNSYSWDGIDNTVQAPPVQSVHSLDNSLLPREIVPVGYAQPAKSLESSVSPRENIASVRHDSADSSSEVSDLGRAKAEEADVQAPTRTRTTDSAKVRHNIVERRYRENINAQVDVLRDSIVATMQAKDEQNGTSSSRLGADELKRLTKAAVIAAATQQIKRARTENEQLVDEHRALQAQIKELEKLVKCGDCPIMGLAVGMGLESSPS